MNETKDIKDIESLYQTMLENTEVGCKPKALGDDEWSKKRADEPNAPEDADGVQDIVTPEEAADDNELYLKKISERLKESKEKSGKSGGKEINNFETMSEDNNKNIFDKLYSTIMEGENPFDDMGEDPFAGGDEEEGLDAPEEGLGEDEVSLSLPRDLAEKLLDTLNAELGGEEPGLGEEDDLGLGDEEGLEDELAMDAVVSEPAPKPLGGGDREHKDAGNVSAGSNKVAASKMSPDGGTASGDASGDDPAPKKLGGHGDRQHKDAGNVSAGSNKVKTTPTGVFK